MVIWLEEFGDKKILVKQNKLIADVIILDEQIMKKVRIDINDNRKSKFFWNSKLWKELIVNGEKRLSIFDTPKDRARKYLSLCDKIVKEGNK